MRHWWVYLLAVALCIGTATSNHSADETPSRFKITTKRATDEIKVAAETGKAASGK